jgi:hypothetical protein
MTWSSSFESLGPGIFTPNTCFSFYNTCLLCVKAEGWRTKTTLDRSCVHTLLRRRQLDPFHGDDHAAELACCQIANAYIQPAVFAVLQDVQR